MHNRMTAEKQKGQSSGSRNNTRSPSARPPNVRTTDHRIMAHILLTNPYSVTPEELVFFQRVLGFQYAVALMEEGKKRKKLEKSGQPVATSRLPLAKNAEPLQPNKAIDKESTVKESENRKSNEGIPGKLRAKIEKLSGVDLSDINVHKNSGKPEQLGALAYTQGKDIYLAPGQDKQLPHESWHAVQQKQGRVPPTLSTQTSIQVNDDEDLEEEADIMAAKAESIDVYDTSKSGSEDSVPDTLPDRLTYNTGATEKETTGEAHENGTIQLKKAPSPRNGKSNGSSKKADINGSNILDIIQNALDIVGFLPGLGDIADAVNVGISIIRKQWLNAVLSAIALIPAIGSAIAAPIKTFVKAAGNTTIIKKAINLLGSLLGGLSKVVSKLSDLFKGLKGTLRKLPKLISSLGDKSLVKLFLGSKGSKAIKSFANSMENGIETVCKEVDKVLESIKKALGKGDGKTLTPFERGRLFEKNVLDKFGWTKNTKKIGNSIPDAIVNGRIKEIKDVKYLSMSKQFREYINSGKPIDLIVNSTTQISKPLMDAIIKSGGTITRF